MRLLIIIAIAGLLAFSVAQAYISNYIAKTEQQPYKVLWKHGELEGRFYPQALMASFTNSVKEHKTSSSAGFRVLAGYIFGGNGDQKSIAMTAPVHMNFSDSGSTMSFVMPAEMDLKSLPKPNNDDIRFVETEEQYVVAIRFGGWANDEKIAENASKLVDILHSKGIEISSEPWYMGYNPPYQLINRRNEVAIRLTKEKMQLLNSATSH
jgi:Tfp pilus assembly protein PilE